MSDKLDLAKLLKNIREQNNRRGHALMIRGECIRRLRDRVADLEMAVEHENNCLAQAMTTIASQSARVADLEMELHIYRCSADSDARFRRLKRKLERGEE